MANSPLDSLFLELGIDTKKFSQDQRDALFKIREFEIQAKRSANNSRDSVKGVGKAFSDLSKDSRASILSLDSLANKFKSLGQNSQVNSTMGSPFGMMAQGLGMILSPATLGIAAVGLLGKEMWDLNKNMTATNATIYRQAQLSGMNATNLWAWGEAARTVGANPQDVTSGIASLQTSIMGMGIGAGDATGQLVALSRLGVGFDFQKGVDPAKLFARVHELAKQQGYNNLGALRALTAPVMNQAMFDIATNKTYDPNKYEQSIAGKAPKDLGKIIGDSLKSQEALGGLGISKDILEEIAYGGEQGIMLGVVELLRKILDVVSGIFDFIRHPLKALDPAKKIVKDDVLPTLSDPASALASAMGLPNPAAIARDASRIGRAWDFNKKLLIGMQTLMSMGVSQQDAAAIIGNMARESTMNPYAKNASGHAGLGQWDAARQEAFRKKYGYLPGALPVPENRQMRDQLEFAKNELQTTHRAAAAAMKKAQSILDKTKAFMDFDEKPGDNSLDQRYGFAQTADRLTAIANMVGITKNKTYVIPSTSTHETNIGSINVTTPATDPAAQAAAMKKAVTGHPLIGMPAQSTVALATRGMSN